MATRTLARRDARRAPRRLATRRTAEKMDYYSFSTRLGWMALAADGERVSGLTFGHGDAPAATRSIGRILTAAPESVGHLANAPAMIRDIVERLKAFARGEPVEFLDVPLGTAHLTAFGEVVTQRCREIAWGQTLSYAELASKCGRPAAARAVGNVMRNNRFPLIVPCHRVLASGGGLGGYSAPQGLALKQRLLTMERHVSRAVPDVI